MDIPMYGKRDWTNIQLDQNGHIVVKNVVCLNHTKIIERRRYKINMRKKHFIVTMKNGKTVFTSCDNEEEASILAQSVMIKHGYTREVQSVVETSNISDMTDTDFID